ncbi:MAG: hypothetical protein OEZ10_13225 [Gammaproteobacteria bacterium]|nr:hypothetical protein [Gammaproteobacteria bacterium]
MITDAENLPRGTGEQQAPARRRGKRNTVGFEQVTPLNFCSFALYHEAFNTGMNLSNLRPFRLVIYGMGKNPEKITIITVRAPVLMKRDKAKNQRVARQAKERIIKAITDGVELKL